MPTFKITDPNTGKTVRLTGDSAPTEQELNDIFSQIGGNQTTPAATPKQEEGGFLSDIAAAGANRLSNISNPKDSRLRKIPIVGPTILGPASNVAGQGLGFLLGDLPIAAAKAVVPEGAKKEIGRLVATQKGNPIIDIASEAWKANPEDIRNDYENLLNISMIGPQGSFLRGAARGTSSIGKEGFNIARDAGTLIAQKTPAAVEKKLAGVITPAIQKGIRPTVVGKRTAQKMGAYYDRANEAVKIIIKNKENLALTDAAGGELPQNLKQFAEAIEQTKRGIYNQYHAMTTEAGEAGATFNAEGIISKLDGVANDLKYNPQVRKYADDLKAEIGELHGQPPDIVEARIADLNNSLTGYYEGRIGKAKAQVDGSVAKQMREELDNIIMNASDPGYQDLKNQYGALKSLEKEVNHRAVVFARQSPNGFFDVSDIFTTGEILGGVLSMNPAMIAKGLAGKAAKKAIKQANNADRIIQKMFSESENIINKSSAAMPEMRSAAGRAIMGQLSGMDNILAQEAPGAIPIPRRPVTSKMTTAIGPVRSGVLKGEPYGPAAPTLIQPKRLPPGQGFELNGEAYAPDIIDVPFTSSTRPIPTLVAPENMKQTLSLPPGQGFELVQRPALQVPKETGTLVEEPTIRDDSFGAGTRAARERMKARETAKEKESENIITRIIEMGGIKWTQDYNPKILRQNPDAKRTLNNKTGQAPDAIAAQLQAEGWPISSSDEMMELIKSGKGRIIYNPQSQDRLLNREINRRENEYIKKQLQKLEAEGNYQSADIGNRIPDHQARFADEIRTEGLVEEGRIDEALKEVSDFFEEMSGQKKQPAIEKQSSKEIGTLVPRR